MSPSDADLDEATTDPPTDRETETEADQLELAARAELLEEENRRLRAEYARARRSQYRRTAAGLALVGAIAALATVVFPDGREVLFALAAVGLFGGVLTYYVTPESFVAATVGERVYAPMAANEAALASELGLSDDRVYIPDDADVRLYVPQRSSDEPPSPDELEGPVLTDAAHRGLALEPTGATLFDAFERALPDAIATAPAPLATQLVDGLVEQFELADGADADVDVDTGRVTVAIDGSAFGDVDRFDHPIASFLAVGFATGLERPIRLEIESGDERSDWLVTCRWEADDETSEKTDSGETRAN
ncbi:hypothetical protein [Natrinema salaciae]|uniref:DUF7982 domain-containing protein n=1 Tax=Natrinema salaciae TaxID=1186196 RepID=A0A1H9BWQ4_9EURY|nr:hypothetical protein [Natrinema salaciae]SEP93319.1 hypothetical protein SAMN04489841_0880 [Natrinema salaciae]